MILILMKFKLTNHQNHLAHQQAQTDQVEMTETIALHQVHLKEQQVHHQEKKVDQVMLIQGQHLHKIFIKILLQQEVEVTKVILEVLKVV